jgi:hypothetical protein
VGENSGSASTRPLVAGSCTSHPGVPVPHRSQPRPGWAPDLLMIGIRSPGGLVVGLAPATLEFWVRFPNERNQGKQGATLCQSTGLLTGPSPALGGFLTGPISRCICFPMSAHLSRLRLFQRHLHSFCWDWVWVWDWLTLLLARSFTRSSSSCHPPLSQYLVPSRSLVRYGQTSPHMPRLVVPHSTCPSLSPSPPRTQLYNKVLQ